MLLDKHTAPETLVGIAIAPLHRRLLSAASYREGQAFSKEPLEKEVGAHGHPSPYKCRNEGMTSGFQTTAFAAS